MNFLAMVTMFVKNMTFVGLSRRCSFGQGGGAEQATVDVFFGCVNILAFPTRRDVLRNSSAAAVSFVVLH